MELGIQRPNGVNSEFFYFDFTDLFKTSHNQFLARPRFLDYFVHENGRQDSTYGRFTYR